ncbi:MAG TPA: bifunctional hydroxymethylpyrimidine kinase/phosphomethylpyrimidine kinase [Candidatus Binatia bacterium]|nr:bifunctional hydroxymethylpyrimidine kinase/phosphomethylpyrimidine kinase [Candidatus Binatia bacterium]
MRKIFTALTIAGSDSGAGAGIQADLKTFAANGVYGTSAIAAITAQNTRRVKKIHSLPPAIVAAQIDAVVDDIGADAVKTGMLLDAEIVKVVAAKVRAHGLRNLVVDPVMAAKSGDLLLRKDAIAALKSKLIPLATVVTPNVPEAEELTGIRLKRLEDFKAAARRIVEMGAKTVVIKGGHRRGPATDLFYDGKKFHEFSAPRLRTRNTHGTGCTFAAAIAAHLAKGAKPEEAVGRAKRYLTRAIAAGYSIGAGNGPVNHFYKLRIR